MELHSKLFSPISNMPALPAWKHLPNAKAGVMLGHQCEACAKRRNSKYTVIRYWSKSILKVCGKVHLKNQNHLNARFGEKKSGRSKNILNEVHRSAKATTKVN